MLEDPETERTAVEVPAMLRQIRLPHQQIPGPSPLDPAAEHPEIAEPPDELTDHGFDIGRVAHGRGGLPDRLQAPASDAAEGGRRAGQLP